MISLLSVFMEKEVLLDGLGGGEGVYVEIAGSGGGRIVVFSVFEARMIGGGVFILLTIATVDDVFGSNASLSLWDGVAVFVLQTVLDLLDWMGFLRLRVICLERLLDVLL